MERPAADVDHNGGNVVEVPGLVWSGCSAGGRNPRVSSALQPYRSFDEAPHVPHPTFLRIALRQRLDGFNLLARLGVGPRYHSGPQYARLPIVRFVEDSDDLVFGFLGQPLVIRGCHLIPRFASGRTYISMSYQGPTAARPSRYTDDWTNFYVNMYVLLFPNCPRFHWQNFQVHGP